ncbi:FecR family protein [Comamonas squillarum]|uniref:FecR domain-containing protein n=1 Tax=Comamonas squillarum TaxID=2977320 RepID=A0ABY6A0H5_9BURK|nr:FecR domain-containing protein [Comamonas sp. PR12]UXC19044.1 FecR domain-containing protein [Comamonas sp. PR12]
MSQQDFHHRHSAPSRSLPPSHQEAADARDYAEFIAGQDPLEVEAIGWMVRRQDGLTAAEEAELQEWLERDPEHAKALEQAEGVWGRMDELPEAGVDALKAGLPPSAEGPAALALPPIADRAAADERRRPSGAPSSPGRRAWLANLGWLLPQAGVAAVALGMVGSGWYGWNLWQQQPTFTQSLATARGEQRQLALPDGSTLWLDTATQVEVSLYRQRREVRLLEGQAFFTVQTNSAQPFDVLAGATRVTVVGTRFSVRNTRSGLGEEGRVSVAVEQGRVRVASRQSAQELAGAGAAVELVAGQSVSTDASGLPGPVQHEAAPAANWREGRVSFNGSTLAQAVAEFERYGDTGLVIRDPAVGALKVHGSFELRQLGAFARALPRVLPVRLVPKEGKTEITAARGG